MTTRCVARPTTDRWVRTEQVLCEAREGIEDCGPSLGYQWGLVFTPTEESATVIGAFLVHVPDLPLAGKQKYLLLRLADGSHAFGVMHWDRGQECHRLVRSEVAELDPDRMAEQTRRR